MESNKQGILAQIIKLDNSLRIRKCNFSQNINSDRCAIPVSGEVIEDYKMLREGIENSSLNIQYRKLAFQPIKVVSRQK